MTCWTSETEKIIKAHEGDFDYINCEYKLRSYGGYKGYLNKLGGVFKKWNGKTANVKTAKEFQEIAQYVFGLMAIYGFNYNNDVTHVKWGGSMPFYPNANSGRCNWGRIDDLCSQPGLDKTTNCNFGMDALYYKAGIAPKAFDYSYRYKWFARTYKVIHKKSDLVVGDMLHFFHGEIKNLDPNTWEGWGHVACVGEKSGGKVVLYDAGNRFIRSGDFKKQFTVDANNKPTGEYDNYDGWIGIHLIDLAGATGEVKGDSELAVEVIAGKWGSNLVRRARLGNRYKNVQERVNYFLSGTLQGREAYLRAAASYVLKGFAGNEAERMKFFGKNYTDVQKKVNWVLKTAQEVIDGKYGNGDTRRMNLGIDYNLVQAQVDRMV